MLATFDIGTMMSQENQIKEIPLDMLNHTYNHQFTMYLSLIHISEPTRH